MDYEFEISWQIDDGSRGKNSHGVVVRKDSIDEGLSEGELKDLFWSTIEEDFSCIVHAVCDQEDEFVAWAKQVQKELAQEN